VLEDRRLVRRFNRGDKEAMRHIYEKYQGDLLKVAAALLQDRSMIEDVLHDVFVSFAQKAGKFRLSGSLKGYLAICVANRARDMNRTRQRQPFCELDRAEAICSNANEPQHAAATGELSQLLTDAMAQLPYDQREIIILRLQSKIKFRQIAKSYGLSVNTIQSRYRYGLEKLRAILNGQL